MFGIIPASAQATFDAFSPGILRWSLSDFCVSSLTPDLFIVDRKGGVCPLFCSSNDNYLGFFCSKVEPTVVQPISYHLNGGISKVLHPSMIFATTLRATSPAEATMDNPSWSGCWNRPSYRTFQIGHPDIALQHIFFNLIGIRAIVGVKEEGSVN